MRDRFGSTLSVPVLLLAPYHSCQNFSTALAQFTSDNITAFQEFFDEEFDVVEVASRAYQWLVGRVLGDVYGVAILFRFPFLTICEDYLVGINAGL